MKTDNKNIVRVQNICAAHNNQPDALLEILHDVQAAFDFLSKNALIEIANALNISRADIHGVVSFYDDFRLEAPKDPCVKICRGEACQAVGGENLAAHVKATGTDTHDVYCLGNCALGPAVMIDDKLYGRVDAQKLDALLKEVS